MCWARKITSKEDSVQQIENKKIIWNYLNCSLNNVLHSDIAELLWWWLVQLKGLNCDVGGEDKTQDKKKQCLIPVEILPFMNVLNDV